MTLPDVQNERGNFCFALKAGVRGLVVPIGVLTQQNELVNTVARVDMFAHLPEDLKGINMSRLPILLAELDNETWIVSRLPKLLWNMQQVMETQKVEVVLQFPYFYKKAAPISRLEGMAHVDVAFHAGMSGDNYRFTLTVIVPVTTLCPCSREISENGAHNQRAEVTMSVYYNKDEFVWIEDLIDYAEASASSALYPVLKRPDEKFVTEYAYSKPRFVEDLAREVALKLRDDKRISLFHVAVQSHESIHQHDAFAEIEGGLKPLWLVS